MSVEEAVLRGRRAVNSDRGRKVSGFDRSKMRDGCALLQW